jgi:hypothetical protein
MAGKPPCLEHMDIGSRNARLCAYLQSLGLVVIPVPAADDPERIDHMLVSVSLPTNAAKGAEAAQDAAEQAASLGVAAPVSRSKVGEQVTAAESHRSNVVYLPAVLAVPTVF